MQNLLNATPGYQIRGENNNALMPLAHSWHLVNNSEPMTGLRKSGKTSDARHPFFGAELVDPKMYGAALAECFTRSVLQPAPDVRVSGFKEIRFHLRPKMFASTLNFMRRFFPKARFVFNTRDHDAVCQSGWWRSADPDKVKAELSGAEKLFNAYMARHPKVCTHVHYDTYVKQPQSLGTLFDFLGEPLDTDRLAQVFDTRLDHARAPDQTPSSDAS